MLINRVSEDGAGEGLPEGGAAARHGDSHEYQTANELFELMAKNHPFEHNIGDTLSASDLVILYKNIEIGTKLMSNVDELNRRTPNQYVETIVYRDEPESDGSDASDMYGDDLHDVFSINKERIDLLSNPPSLENTLCHKFGDLEMHTSNMSTVYDKHFPFKDPYIKEQLKNLNALNSSSNEFDGNLLPASLLDYICCKRLEDNYNFYMDNIIRYVKQTIEQLKRISNGDYLTEKAKEKWKEVESAAKDTNVNYTKVLATSASIPLQVERKANGHMSTWDDIIHSEVDIRSLSKILEKKIVVEVPKLICGSYQLLSKLCSDNLVVSCKREHQPINTTEKKESRVDVVLQLGRSVSGQVISNISSIMILQANLPTKHDESTAVALLPVPYFEVCKSENEKQPAKIVEIKEDNVEIEEAEDEMEDAEFEEANYEIDEDVAQMSNLEAQHNRSTETHDTSLTTDQEDDDNENENIDSRNTSYFESGDSSVALRDILDTRAVPNVLRKEAPFNFISPDDLTLSMHKLNMSSLAEESGEEVIQLPVTKNKPPSKVRVKSPYENKSYLIEERKRKRLLEIRERREKRKIAMSENCKITKHRYGKGPIAPQPSSSVTKLSITNKSFYNSIYGQNPHCIERQSLKCNPRKGKSNLVIETSLEHLGDEQGTQILTPEINSKKYINRSYYLDDAVTEIMYTQPSDCSSEVRELFSASTSVVSNDLGANLNMLSKIINNPNAGLKTNSPSDALEEFGNMNTISDMQKEEICTKIVLSESTHNVVPSNSPDEFSKDYHKRSSSIECRKSIEKIYDLMKKLGNIETLERKSSRPKFSFKDLNKLDIKAVAAGQGSSTIQCSDSGTSLKHHLTSSSPSCFSFEKVTNADDVFTPKSAGLKKADALTNVVPKVIISTKHQATKLDTEKLKKERKKISVNALKVSDNPLKAISQLLHEFDSVQKTRLKTPTDSKINRKAEVFDGPAVQRPSSLKRRSRIDHHQQKHVKDDLPTEKNVKVSYLLRDRRSRPVFPLDPLKLSHQPTQNEDRYVDCSRKKLSDMMDEEREARGEAVKGPSKFTSRLNSLAQPKKSYVQAHSEEYKTKYGRNLMADRLQRLAATVATVAAAGERPAGSARRSRRDPAAAARQQPPLGVPKHGRSASASPVGQTDASAYASHAPSAPETLKNKMVAVESYVKSHYGRAAAAAKARVPLVPHDLDLGSVPSSPGEESTTIGSKLHRIINSMIKAKPVALAALAESRESGCSKDGDGASRAGKHSDDGDPSSVESDYRVDIFEDKHVRTAVQTFPEGKREKSATDETSERSDVVKSVDVEINKSATELQLLEKALHRRLPAGTFQNRLRIKNLTITPKQSVQQVFLLQSGDAGSILLKSTVSKSLKLSSSQSDFTTNVETLPSLTSPQMDWKVTSIPMQITTIGYAFPKYDTAQCSSKLHIRSLHDIFKGVSRTSIKNKSITDTTHQPLKELPQVKLKQDMHTNAISSDINYAEAEHAAMSKEEQLVSTATVTATIEKAEESYYALKEMSAVINNSLDKVADVKETNIENIDCTSSLDMLVGLLNEIQKITACHINNTEIGADNKECTQLEYMLLNNNNRLGTVAEYNDSHELVSISSLDKLRQLESSPSIYSMYISNDEIEPIDDTINIPNIITSAKSVLCSRPSCVDKEVSADLPVREFTNTFTDVPSKVFPITITHSTNVTNSLLGILSKPSTQSMFSFRDCETIYSDSSFKYQKRITEISEPSIIKTIINKQPLVLYPETVKDQATILAKNEMIKEIKIEKTELISFRTKHELPKSKCVKGSDFDPLLKMKRDILVTVYSMLVLTVFAALSFPEILYYA